jgi:hypothetical protein
MHVNGAKHAARAGVNYSSAIADDRWSIKVPIELHRDIILPPVFCAIRDHI